MSYRDIVKSHYPLMYRPLSGGTSSAIDQISTPIFLEGITASSGVAASTFVTSSAYTIGGWFFLYHPGGELFTLSRMAIGDSLGYFNIGYGRASAAKDNQVLMAASHWTGSVRLHCSALVPLYTAFHFAVTWNGTTMRVYVNGQENGTATGSGSPLLTGTFGAGRMNGSIAGMHRAWGIGVWNSVLSAGNIATWYGGTVPGTPTGYWPMNEATASGGVSSTCFNVGGSAGINLALSSTYRSEDDRTFSVTGSLNQNSESLVPADGYSSTYFDGNVANYIAGQTFYESSAATMYQPYTYEYWIKPASFSAFSCLLTQGSGTNVNRNYIDARHSLQLLNATTTQPVLPSYPLQAGSTYHVISQYDAWAPNLTTTAVGFTRGSKLWVNGRPVGIRIDNISAPNTSPSAPTTLWHNTTIGHSNVTNISTIAANTGFIGNAQEIAYYRRTFTDDMALQHYLAGTDVDGYAATPISASFIAPSTILLRTSKPLFYRSLDDIQIPGLEIMSTNRTTGGDMLIDLFTAKPLVYLKLNESSGNFIDSSGNGYDGVPGGTITRSITGQTGSGVRFSAAADGYIDISIPSMRTDAEPHFTVSFWVKPVTVTNTSTLVSLDDGSTSAGWCIECSSTAIQAKLRASVLQTQAQTITLTNTWQMVTFVVDYNSTSASLRFWKNDTIQVINNTITSITYLPYNGVVRIGNRSSGVTTPTRADAEISDFKIYNKALSNDEVLHLFRLGMARRQVAADPTPIDGYTYSISLGSNVTDARGQAPLSTSIAVTNQMTIDDTDGHADIIDNLVLVDGNTFITQGSGIQIRYYMRAYNTNLAQFVYWSALGAPDFSGVDSGYSPGDLQNIVKIGQTV